MVALHERSPEGSQRVFGWAVKAAELSCSLSRGSLPLQHGAAPETNDYQVIDGGHLPISSHTLMSKLSGLPNTTQKLGLFVILQLQGAPVWCDSF